MKSKKEQKRELILSTVSQLIREEGVEKLTLEAVATKAGISKGGLLYHKGGLLYHFPSKDALILGMIEQLSDRFITDFRSRAEEDTESKGKWTRSYVDTSVQEELCDLYVGISAAHFTNPEMLQQLQETYVEIQEKMEHDEVDPVRSTMARLAIDGLWLADMFGLASPQGAFRQQIIEHIKESIQEEQQ